MAKDPDALGVFARIKLFFGGLGILGAGVFLYIAPVEELKEYWWHRHAGIAAMALGGLMLLVLFTEGSSGRLARAFNFRLKSLLGVIAGVLFAGLIGFFLVPVVHDAWRLRGDRGNCTMATRLSTGMHSIKGKTSFTSKVRYDGHVARVSGRVDKTVSVVYLADEPDAVLKGVQGDSFVTLVDRNVGKWTALGTGLFGVFIAFFALIKLKHFFFGRSRATPRE